ncbi:universal stress protein [Roseivirga pacifica]|uniref:universal stress protein n=1 Tax=Roseivirga pacifica TaxID=1267423 RepID=UPI00227CB276|nr:universal stress protein [Roseivirga pacifica]
MYQKILVPIDFTNKSLKAIQMAKIIAHKTGAQVQLVHVIRAALAAYLDELGNYKSKYETGQKFLDDIIEMNRTKMDEFITKVELDGIKLDSSFKVDSSPDKIAELVTEEGFDLTIVGNYEHEKFDEFLRKTHPEKIAALAKNPVITVNNAPADGTINRILVPTNLVNDCSKKIDELLNFQRTFAAKLNFVYINTPTYFKSTPELAQLQSAWAKNHGIDVNDITVFNALNLKKGILAAADFHQSDMIGLFSRHQGSVKHLVRGTITEWLISKSDIPVITFNLNL